MKTFAGTFVARYRTRCVLCDDPVDEGEQCVYVDDGVAHLDCAIAEGYDNDD